MMRRTGAFILVLLFAGILSACGQEQEAGSAESNSVQETEAKEAETEEDNSDKEAKVSSADRAAEHETVSDTKTEASLQAEYPWKEQFGEYCIPEQTFEMELSEYSGKVCFVPFMPSGDEGFRMQIVQDGKVLTEIAGYVPERLADESFNSLDAVSFFDVNYDGNTDIVLIETYGGTCFAAVYYGFASKGNEYEKYFIIQEQLSEKITSLTDTLTIPAVKELLAGGRKNGEFSGYQEAYEAVGMLAELESTEDITYNLIYVDGDDVPELAAGVNGYYTSLYTYRDGTAYTLMDHWAYGAMGNSGYDYAPKKNSIRNYNADYAGAILYTTYMEISEQCTLDNVVQIETFNFDDVNGNGVLDEEEQESMGVYGVSYIDKNIVTDEECASYDVGGYEQIPGNMSLDELRAELLEKEAVP